MSSFLTIGPNLSLRYSWYIFDCLKDFLSDFSDLLSSRFLYRSLDLEREGESSFVFLDPFFLLSLLSELDELEDDEDCLLLL